VIITKIALTRSTLSAQNSLNVVWQTRYKEKEEGGRQGKEKQLAPPQKKA